MRALCRYEISGLGLALLTILISFSAPAQTTLQWSGATSGDWDINNSINWLRGATPTVFTNGASAVFGDGATGPTSINLTTAVQPASVVVTNRANVYTFSGPGNIGGSGGLTKLATNYLYLYANGNTYTGPTIVSNGIVVITNIANGGLPSSIGAAPSAAANLKLAGGTLSYRGLPASSDRGYLVAGNSGLDVQSDLKLSGNMSATSGTFTKSGPANLTYSSAGQNQLSAGGGGGAYSITGGSVILDGTAGQTNAVTGEFWVGSTPASPGSLVLSNATLNISSWLAVGRGNGSSGFASSATLNNSTLSSGNLSLGYANGLAGNSVSPSLTLNGNSKLSNSGVFNLSENTGSSCTFTINNNSWLYSANHILAGMQSGASGAIVIGGSAAVTNGGYVSLGAGGTGSASLSNNAIWSAPGDFNLADTANSVGTLTIQDNALLILNTFYLGKSANCTGTVYQTGGTVLSPGGGENRIGGNTSAAANQLGIYYLSNGVLNSTINLQVGAYGTGYFNQSGGTATVAGWPSIGRFAGGIGYLNVSGGTFNQSGSGQNLIIGEQGTGTLSVSNNGVVSCVSSLVIGNSAGGVGTVNLNGGRITAKSVVMNDPGANSTFNFNGGTLRAAPAAITSFMGGLSSATVQSGGAVVDSGTNVITISQDLQNGGGGFTKLGSGALTLSGNLYYSGATAVSNGTLLVAAPNSFASTSCTVAAGASFGVFLASANAQLVVPTLSLTAAGAGLTFNNSGLGGQTVAPLLVNSLTVSGPAVINIAGVNWTNGQYPLVQIIARTGSGGFTLGSLSPGMAGYLVTNVPNQSIDIVVTAPSSGPQWQPKQAPLMTDWAQQVNPTNVMAEYPRPQMQRTNWLNLNGVWQFQPGTVSDPVPVGQNLASQILVPFPMESALSGIMQYSAYSWYRRTFTVPTNWNGQRILLHLDAVNWQSQVYINGQSVGTHTGAYDPVTYDVTPYLSGSGAQELIVRVFSPVDAMGEPRGKQTLYPGGIMYISSSGIWQPAWLEPVPATSIGTMHLVPDIDNNRLQVSVTVTGPTNGVTVSAVAFDGSNQVASATGSPGSSFYVNIPSPKLWSPTNPYLYNLQISLSTNSTTLDSVASYFAMRKISIGTNNGFLKMFLNNQFTFQFGPLDQGFWPDGEYTAPTDLALKSDIEIAKAVGFNMIRKHIKVERQRWYYWADKLGVLVWQDMPSCNSYTGSPQQIDPLDFIAELTAMITNHWNSPSIIMWDIFNEGQGQSETGAYGQTNTTYLVQLAKTLDPSRLVNQASGNNWVGAGDLLDGHYYPSPSVPSSTSQAVACGEFGGVSLVITNHTWNSTVTGEGSSTNAADLLAQFQGFCGLLSGFIADNGMSAAVYTQTTDVETELNGLKTYDRKVLKPDLRGIQTAINSTLGQYAYTVIVPTSQINAQSWKYTFTTPAGNWYTSGFNDSAWTNGNAAFGSAGTPGISVNTTWNTADIWMRRTFNPGALTPQQITNLLFKVYHDEGCEIYVNGVLACSASGYVTAYGHIAMNAAGQAAIVTNASNVLAVHCHQTTGGQGIDVGIDSMTVVVPPPPIYIPNWTENGAGLTAQYFSGTNLSSLAFSRTDTNVNFNWGFSSPGAGLPANHFSTRWTGKVQPRYTEGYTFHLTTADGCRLWVNGQLLIDKWHDDTGTDTTGSISLTGGQQFDVKIEYYNNTNAASAVLEWESASQTRQVVPQDVLFPANTAPVMAAIPNATLVAGQTLVVTNSATDSDVPAQTLTWSLLNPPSGAVINSTNGLLTWRPAIAQSPTTNTLTVQVTDNGTPPLGASRNFQVTVLRPATPSMSLPGYANGTFQVSVTGSLGPDYLIYTKTNLTQPAWSLLLTTNPSVMPFLFTDPTANNFAQRFYRIQLGP